MYCNPTPYGSRQGKDGLKIVVECGKITTVLGSIT